MDALVIIPFILFLVVIFTAIAERINIPYPILLVIVGLSVGFIPQLPNWRPPSEVVLPVFLPPILFAAARLVSWHDIKSNILEIIMLAGLLVITSAIAIAYSLNTLAPVFTLSSALVLGAIISPTDCISATSILNKMNTKPRLVRSLEIESLFNDAISITLYNGAIFLVFNGSMDLVTFSQSVFPQALGGITVGLVLAYFTGIIVNNFLQESESELPIIMSLILAYVSYLFADQIGVSGVLAVVTAGLFHTRTERSIKARTRLAEKASWDTFIFFLHGVAFIIIGLQFPVYLKRVMGIPAIDLVALSLITITILLFLRFSWVTLLILFKKLLAKHQLVSASKASYNWRDIIISSWSGMRGLVSLALAIALPMKISGHTKFPNRNLIVFLTIICIIFTVVIQGLTLPLIVKWLNVKKDSLKTLQESNRIYQHITKMAIAYIERLEKEEKISSSIAKQLIDNYYESRLLRFKLASQAKVDTHEIALEAEEWLKKTLSYERNILHSLMEQAKISQEAYLRILSKIDRDEVGFSV